MISRILDHFFKPEPEPVDDFRDVLEDLWHDREAREDAELRRRIQFEMECAEVTPTQATWALVAVIILGLCVAAGIDSRSGNLVDVEEAQ